MKNSPSLLTLCLTFFTNFFLSSSDAAALPIPIPSPLPSPQSLPSQTLPPVKLYYEIQPRQRNDNDNNNNKNKNKKPKTKTKTPRNKTILIPQTIESSSSSPPPQPSTAGRPIYTYVRFQKIVRIPNLYHARVANGPELIAAGIDAGDFSCKLYEKRGRGFDFDFEGLRTVGLGGGDEDEDVDGSAWFWGHLRNVVYVSCAGRVVYDGSGAAPPD